jgi:streptogramin lyase
MAKLKGITEIPDFIGGGGASVAYPDWDGNDAGNFNDIMKAYAFNTILNNQSGVPVTPATFGSISNGYRSLVAAPNNKIFMIPLFASPNELVVINTTNDSVTKTGSFGSRGWLGGVLAPNGFIYCAPAESGSGILKIDPGDNSTSYIGTFSGYRGAVLAPNGKIYFIPSDASSVLVLDPTDDSTYTFGSLSLSLGYIGGALAPDGNIYCAPFAATQILKINTTNDTVSSFGSLGSGNKWTGTITAPNGKLYGVPFASSTILYIDPKNDSSATFDSLGGGNKYFGGCLGPNGKIYFAPHDAGSVLELNPTDHTRRTYTSITGRSGVIVAHNGFMYFGSEYPTNIAKLKVGFDEQEEDFIFSRFFNKF